MSEEVRSDDGVMDPVHIKFLDGTRDSVLIDHSHGTRDTDLMENYDGTGDTDHMKVSDGTMDPVFVEVSDGTKVTDHMKFPDGTMDSVLMKVSDGTRDTDCMKVSDGTMDLVLMEVSDSAKDTDHNKFPYELDPDEVHTKVPDEVHTKVPDELWLRIKSFLSAGDLAKLGATSHRYNSLSKDPTLWQKLVIDVGQINHHYQSLEAVIGRATQLKYIRITDEMEETFDEGSFVNGMPPDGDNLNFDENAMVALIEKAKATLISLTVGNIDEIDIELENKTIVKFGCLSQLETLELCGNDLKTSGMKAIAKLKNLKVLKIPGVCCRIAIKKTVLNDSFRELKNLRVVDLSSHRITKETLSILAQNNPNLEELNLYGCRGLNVGNFNVGSSLPNLRKLSLKTTAIKKLGLRKMVRNCTQLSHINLMWCHNLNKGFLGILKKNCPNLEHLKIGYLPPDALKKDDLSVFTTHFKKLKYLDLSGFTHPELPPYVDEEFMQAMANRGIEIELQSSMC